MTDIHGTNTPDLSGGAPPLPQQSSDSSAVSSVHHTIALNPRVFSPPARRQSSESPPGSVRQTTGGTPVSDAPPSPPPQQHPRSPNSPSAHAQPDSRTAEEQETGRKLAERLSSIIEDANAKCGPLCKMIRKHIENMEARKEEDRDEAELVKSVKPLLEQAEKILHETNGAIRGADPDNRLSNKATRNTQDHKATPEEQRLAEALKVMVQEVGGTIEWAKDKLDSYPKAKKDLGPLLDALGQPLTQIVGGVGLLLAGVLNLVGRLLSGLGLGGLLKGIIAATGLDKLYSSLGLGKWLNMK